MKILLVLLIIFSNYLFSNGQPVDDGRLRPLQFNVVARNFKPDRSPDFGIELSPSVVPGIMTSNLGPNKRPQYSLGSNPFVDDAGQVLVHSETTFNQWFNSDDQCTNYLLTFPLSVDIWDSTVQIGSGGAFYPLEGRGFGDAAEFPQYASDPFNQYFCYEVHFSTIASDPDIDVFRYSTQGELWVYFDDQLVYDSGGEQTGYSASVNLEYRSIEGLEFDGVTVHSIDLYTCYRSTEEFIGGIPLNLQSQANLFCSWIDQDGVCNGDNVTAPCIEDPLSCVTKEPLCGNCLLGLRQCPGEPTTCTLPKCFEGEGCLVVNITCNDQDVCTEDICDEELGCIGNPIPGCHCNSTNCITTDLCEPRSCVGEQCIGNPVDCSLVFPDCDVTFCNNGECFCTFNPDTTGVEVTSTTPTIAITTAGVTTISATTATTTSATITSATVTSATVTSATITSATVTSGSESTVTSSIGITSSYPKPDPTRCDEFSCPHHYCCIQLFKSYTCVTKHFEESCQPQRLSIFF